MVFSSGYALVIGVGSYQNVPNLNAPLTAEDAQEVKAVLCDSRYCAYPEEQVKLLHDGSATRQAILSALDSFAQIQEGDTFLLFYSGHGEYGEDKHYYLTTHETELVNGKVKEGSGIREKELLEKLQAIKAKRTLLIFNACYSGEISPESLSAAEEVSGQRSLPEQAIAALLGTGQGRVVITACRETQKSYFLKNASMTFFGKALSEGLRGEGIENRRGYVSVFDLYQAVFETVSGEVQRRFGEYGLAQEPELTVQKGIGAMAVALHRGKSPGGELTDQEGLGTLSGEARKAAKEIEPAQSQKALQQILSGEFNFAVGGDIQNVEIVKGNKHEGDIINAEGAKGIVNRPSGPVNMDFGNKTTVHGDYAGRDINKNVYTNAFSSSNASTPTISLEEVDAQLKQKIELARQKGQDDLVEDLAPLDAALQSALNAESSGRLDRKQAKLGEAKRILQSLIRTYPDLQGIATLFQQLR
ncbi:caspase family protein [Leptolyngbya sp. PL-A3]|uniref:caspase family protein n=1 Tax=Leptolyngbya sp. PL-A3 TaxID=2933911 RepID=UPI0032984B76